MGIFFVYILKSSVCLTIFYLFYKLLLSRDTFHRFNRIALLSLIMLSVIIPFCEITLEEATAIQRPVMDLENLLAAVSMRTSAESASQPVWLRVMVIAYIIGGILTLCQFAYSFYALFRLMRQGTPKLVDGIHLILMDQPVVPFSWMRTIVISRKDFEESGIEIMTHEMAHIKARHSIDLLISEICILFHWFNPSVWLLRQELQNIHEYEADESVLNQGVDAKRYQLLLIKKAVGAQRFTSMANSFNHSKLKKRITMMLKEKSNPWARLKYLYVLPLAAIAVTAFARPEISGKMDEISAVKVNDFVQIVGTKVPEKKVEVLKDTVKKDAPKEEAFEVSRLETVPTHSKVTITDGMKRSGMDLFSVRNAGSQPQPLILVDGKEITGEQMQRDINPDMIESISVLKDEASTAIYGDKAKHGVILITLKGKDVQNVLSLSASDPEDGVKVVGVVKDHLDKPLAGASVFISGTVSGTMSDAYGRFVLLAPKNAMLRISYTGMTTVEKAVAPEVNVTLNPAD